MNNAQNKTTAGFLQPAIYSAKAQSAFNDISSGNNGAFAAGTGWDPCTGLGSPIGSALIKLLSTTLGGTTKPTKKPPTRKEKPPTKPVAKET